MRIHHVRMSGFGPFRSSQLVAFDAFADDGIFLISGKTGAGKSSILDGISYALYGKVPRYESGDASRLRSDHCGPEDPTEVELEFSTSQGRFRIVRRPEYLRPKKRGEGFTTQPASVEFAQLRDGTWTVLDTKVGEVGARVLEVVGLTGDQFLQVMLLAQGRFQDFLVASSEDRRRILGSIFRTQRFRDHREEFERRSKTVREQREAARRGALAGVTSLAKVLETEFALADPDVEQLRTWIEDALAHHRTLCDQAGRARGVAEAAQREAVARSVEIVARATAFDQRAALQKQHAELMSERETIDGLREHIESARRAAGVWPLIQAGERADAAYVAATEALERATHDAQREGHDLPDDLAAAVIDIGDHIGSLAHAIQAERDLPALEATAASASKAVQAFEREIEKNVRERDELRSEATTRSKAIEELGGIVSGREATQSRLDTLRDRLSRFARLDVLAAECDEAAAAASLAESTRARASAHLSELRQARIADAAGDLAAGLVPGQPCSVCGSHDHPAPATASRRGVSDAELDAAERSHAAAEAASKAASEVFAQARGRCDQLAEALGGFSREQTALDEAELDVALADIDQAAKEHDSLLDASRRDSVRLDELSVFLDASGAQASMLAGTAASANGALDAARRAIDAAKGEFDSVAARVDELTRRRSTLNRVDEARRVLAAADARRAEAVMHLNDALVEHNFASADDVRAARQSDADLAAHRSRVRQYDESVAVVSRGLESVDFEHLGSERPDPVPAIAAADEATASATAAADVASARRDRQRSAESVAGEAAAELDAWASLDDRAETLVALADLVRGRGANTLRMDLETFVLAAELEEIIAAANVRLHGMSHGRFSLEHSDAAEARGVASGLGLHVFDQHTGEPRSPKSLSGGEKFLASLALALGLAEVVSQRAGGVRLDTLFIDEGFGSLDAETLEAAMATLDSLKAGGRTIGLISHVESMKEQIPAQVKVEVGDGGASFVVAAAD